jgi:hypothetical protein
VLCVGLVLLAGTLAVTHSHPDNAVHPDCGLCVVAHVTAKASRVIAEVVVALVFLRATAIVVATRVHTRFSDFVLFTRPPPVDFSLA